MNEMICWQSLPYHQSISQTPQVGRWLQLWYNSEALVSSSANFDRLLPQTHLTRNRRSKGDTEADEGYTQTVTDQEGKSAFITHRLGAHRTLTDGITSALQVFRQQVEDLGPRAKASYMVLVKEGCRIFLHYLKVRITHETTEYTHLRANDSSSRFLGNADRVPINQWIPDITLSHR